MHKISIDSICTSSVSVIVCKDSMYVCKFVYTIGKNDCSSAVDPPMHSSLNHLETFIPSLHASPQHHCIYFLLLFCARICARTLVSRTPVLHSFHHVT